MKIGIHFGVALYELAPDASMRIVRKAEELGFDSAWCGDHLVLPASLPLRDLARRDFPVRKLDQNVSTARQIFRQGAPMLDVFQLLSYLSTATTRLRFGTAIYVLPLRDPIVSARAAATCDLLTKGRLTLGVGIGWLPDEYEATGIDFTTRGRRMDECIGVLRRLWAEEEPQFEGEFFSFRPLRFDPKPVQQPCLPIYIGGESPRAMRRAAALGDGWCARNHTPASLGEQVARLREMRQEFGRHELPFVVQSRLEPTVSVEEIHALQGAGADHFLVPFRYSKNEADFIRDMSEFARRVLN